MHLVIDGELIETTPEHPFYTIAGEWVEAENLTVGDLIWSLDGDYGAIEDIELIQTQQPMYNLTVDEAHTFFVGDGDWLVHNTSCPRLLEIPEGELGTGRYRVATLGDIPQRPGIYELIHLKRNSLPYVGSSRNLQQRISERKYNSHFENYIDVVFTPFNKTIKWSHVKLAETIRILQVREQFGDDIYNMANGWNDDLEKITFTYPTNVDNVPKYWSSRDEFKVIQGLMNDSEYPWPSWLRP